MEGKRINGMMNWMKREQKIFWINIAIRVR